MFVVNNIKFFNFSSYEKTFHFFQKQIITFKEKHFNICKEVKSFLNIYSEMFPNNGVFMENKNKGISRQKSFVVFVNYFISKIILRSCLIDKKDLFEEVLLNFLES